MSRQWVPLHGTFDISKHEIRFEPGITVPGPKPQPPIGIVRCDASFGGGVLSFEVKFEAEGSRAQVILNNGAPDQVFAGLNVLGLPYGLATFSNNRYSPLALSGEGSSLPIGEWIPVRLVVSGSMLILMVRGVEVCRAQHQIFPAQLALYAEGNSTVHFRNIDISTSEQQAFVIMQFSNQYDDLYNEVIRPTCESFGYEVIRADDMYTSNLIIQDITHSINEASLVIADVTPDNPNVYYEVGYAHGIGKQTILLCDRSRERLPFDISSIRTIFYDNSIGGKSRVKERLRRHLENI